MASIVNNDETNGYYHVRWEDEDGIHEEFTGNHAAARLMANKETEWMLGMTPEQHKAYWAKKRQSPHRTSPPQFPLEGWLEEAVEKWITQGRGQEHVYGVRNFLTGLGGVAIRAEIERAIEAAKNVPMGVSQWREHGKKFGYWEYFEEEARTISKLKPNE